MICHLPGMLPASSMSGSLLSALEAVVPVRTQKVVVGNPERQIIVGAFQSIEAVGVTVGRLVRAVEPLDQLFVRAVLRL